MRSYQLQDLKCMTNLRRQTYKNVRMLSKKKSMLVPARRSHMVHFPPKHSNSRWANCLHTQLSSKKATLIANNPILWDGCILKLVQKNKRRRSNNHLLMKILIKGCKVTSKSKINKSRQLQAILIWLMKTSRICELIL